MRWRQSLTRVVWISVMIAVLGQSAVRRANAAGENLPAMIVVNLMSPASPLQRGAAYAPTASSLFRATDTPDIQSPDHALDVAAEAAGGYVVFVDNASHLHADAQRWSEAKLQAMIEIYDEAILELYGGALAFGSIEQWAEAFGVSKANPIVVLYVQGDAHGAPARAAWQGSIPVVTHYSLRTAVRSYMVTLVIHELAHIWDQAHGWTLGEKMVATVQNLDGYPTAKARDEGPREDFAESVTATLCDGYAVNAKWSDDRDPEPDAIWTSDRFDYVAGLFR